MVVIAFLSFDSVRDGSMLDSLSTSNLHITKRFAIELCTSHPPAAEGLPLPRRLLSVPERHSAASSEGDVGIGGPAYDARRRHF